MLASWYGSLNAWRCSFSQITADHGGGYQYRLCSRKDALTEACFQATPLEFAHPEKHTLRFANPSRDHEINATMVTEGGGIGWMRNPKPATFRGCDYVIGPWTKPRGYHCNYNHVHCIGCGPPNYPDDAACPVDNCTAKYPGTPSNVASVPSIFPDLTAGLDGHSFSIEDQVKVPSSIAAGEYVVGFRWDCESSLPPAPHHYCMP